MARDMHIPNLPEDVARWARFGVISLLLMVLSGAAFALNGEDLLPPEKAFRFSGWVDGDSALLHWDIADGYYLYRGKFRFAAQSPGTDLGEAGFPQGEIKHDEYFGEMEIYRKSVDIRLPLKSRGNGAALDLNLTVQGCADAGVCFPPFKQSVSLDWPARTDLSVAPSAKPLGSALNLLGGVPKPAGDLLPADQAFRFAAEVRAPDRVWVGWQIADGYYLYRDKFKFEVSGADGLALGDVQMPRGQSHHDEEFGDVEVFRGDLGFELPLTRTGGGPAAISVLASFQGCADRGVCYPPMKKTVALDLPAQTSVSAAPEAEAVAAAAPLAEQDRIAAALRSDSPLITLASFLGMGLLLAFTPCVFPMIPILSGIIVGHGHRITTGRAFVLSLGYVLASALTYAVFGVLAGLFGSNLQALFQDPKVIILFSGLFVVLALSMFGVLTVQMPAAIQERLTAVSNKQHGGTLSGAVVMGVLSALIVGPCVAAPLAGALIYIGQTGDALLGFLALFALGIGMGLPLLAIGASAGQLLPRAGVWMNTVKAFFGVGLLAIAVWLLERILPSSAAMFLWAMLLIIPAIYLGALDALPHPSSGWRKLWKGVGIVMLAYGVLLLIGVASNSRDPLQPLRGLAAAGANAAPASLTFRRVATLADLRREVATAAQAGRWVMLDYYADWCVSCKEMERYTFADPRVRDALGSAVLLRADVTANSETDAVLLKEFDLIGPPATLFFGPDEAERKAFRVIGYMDADAFLAHLQRAMR